MTMTANRRHLTPMLHGRREFLPGGPAWLLLLLVVIFPAPSQADIFRPAYLEMSVLDDSHYTVLWRVPTLPDQRRLRATVRWPAAVTVQGEAIANRAGDAWEERYTITAPAGLIGERVHIDGLLGGATDVIVRIERGDGTTQLERLTPADAVFTVTASPGALEIAWDYLVLGVEHILAGLDHLLFVLGLLLLVRNLRRLVLTITAFTIAHSITLVSASLGWISLPGPPVEAIIALSIVFVAAEGLREQQGRPSLTARAPWLVAFSFGLLHGLGFAGALEEVGLPETAIPVALLMFNVGVEVGQLLFVAAMVAASWLLGRITPISFAITARVLSYGIGSIAAFWTIERVVAFFP